MLKHLNRFINTQTIKHFCSVLVLFTLAIIAYSPGLTDFMVADDIGNILTNPGIQVNILDSDHISTALTANHSGPLKRPLASLSFGLNYYFSGKAIIPSHFKATNVAIHIANSLLIYAITFLLLNIINGPRKKSFPVYGLAFVIAVIWSIHPLQLTAVLYIVQRMTSMSVFFMLSGFLIYIAARQRLIQDKPYALIQMYSGVIFGTVLGALCKENALLLPYLIAVTELTLLSYAAPKEKQKQKRKQITTLIVITAVIPAAIAIIYLVTHPEFILGGYNDRNFTLAERLMTEARILFQYIQLIIYPNLRQMTLYHDSITISNGLFIPWTTLPAIAGIILSITLSIIFRKKYPVAAFAVLWFLAAHAMESTIFSLLLMFEHRNYLAIFGIVFATGYYLYLLLERLTNKPVIYIVVAITLCASLMLNTLTRARIWSGPGTLTYFDIKHNPASYSAHIARAKYLLDSNSGPIEAYEHLRASSVLDKKSVSPLITMYQLLSAYHLELEENLMPEKQTRALPTNYNSQFVLNSEYITQLSILLNKEIQRRLPVQINPMTTKALRKITNCAVKQKGVPCTRIIQNITDWLNILLGNPRLFPKDRAILYILLSSIQSYEEDYNNALANLNLALRIVPNEIPVSIEKLDVLIKLNDLKRAHQLINQIKLNPHTRPQHLDSIKVTEGALAKQSLTHD